MIFHHYLVIDMNVLLDTNILIDSILFPNRLSENTKKLLDDEKTNIYISSVSLIEVSIKHCKHPTLMPIDSAFLANLIIENGFNILPISSDILTVLEDIMLEKIHNDPFDHILLATATMNDWSLLTKDELLSKYKNTKVILN